MSGIGTLRETALHAALKQWCSLPGDEFEIRVDGFIVDILRGDSVVEIQTHHFYAMRRKLARLVEQRPVRLVHPIALERWIVRSEPDGAPVGRRKSPRRGAASHIFSELVSFPTLLSHPNFTLDVLLIREEELRCRQAPVLRRRWRPREWRVTDRRLLEVVDRLALTCPADCAALLPVGLPQPFTARELATALGQPARIAQQMAYCLREMQAIRLVGKRGNAHEYERV